MVSPRDQPIRWYTLCPNSLQWLAGKHKYDKQNQELHPITWWQSAFHFFISSFGSSWQFLKLVAASNGVIRKIWQD
jgi:hypothetical protein